MKRASILIILLSCFTFLPLKSQIAVIANKSVAKQSLSKTQILDIFSLNVQYWNNGIKIKVFDLKPSNEIKDRFYTAIGVSSIDIKKIWLKMQFSGRAMPPEALESDEEALRKVSITKGAIGFIKASKVTKDVHVLAIIE